MNWHLKYIGDVKRKMQKWKRILWSKYKNKPPSVSSCKNQLVSLENILFCFWTTIIAIQWQSQTYTYLWIRGGKPEHWWIKFRSLRRLESRGAGKNRGEVLFLGMEKLEGTVSWWKLPRFLFLHLPLPTPHSMEAKLEVGAGWLQAPILITWSIYIHTVLGQLLFTSSNWVKKF